MLSTSRANLAGMHRNSGLPMPFFRVFNLC